MLSRDHNILWLPESNGYPTRTILGATLPELSDPGYTRLWVRARHPCVDSAPL